MNVANVFVASTALRPDLGRADRARAVDSDSRADNTIENPEGSPQRKTSRAEFSSLMALLANVGPKVRLELQTQVPVNGASLVDRLLDGGADAESVLKTDTPVMSPIAVPETVTSAQTTDALRYGILNDRISDRVAPPMASGTDVGPLSGLNRTTDIGREHSHAREVLSRIVGRHSSSVDQLKALGDTEAADVRVALDALLSRAGTPAGLELANAAENPSLSAASIASAVALANANTRSAADVSTPVRDTEALAPELRQRLGRVIERMKNEYGHDVGVVETARSQDRQDFLYEQGRSRPGAVVTWTRDSAHTNGAAVDVNIDGGWKNAEAFGRLQRIAREEGLRTLGVRDPGHLELASAAQFGGGKAAQDTTVQAKPQVATAAAQSGVAHVAGVASAAGIARVAEPGAGGNSRRTFAVNSDLGERMSTETTSTMNTATLPDGARSQSNAFGRGERDDQGRPQNDGRTLGAARRESLDAVQSAVFSTAATAAGNTGGGASAVIEAAGVAAAERVSDIQQMRDNVPAGSMSRMTLNVDKADGGQDRITIDVRGTSVGTQIATDTGSADRLRMHTAELQDALSRHGLDSDTVRITGVRSETTDARLLLNERDGARIGAASPPQQHDGSMQHGHRERAATAREWDRQEASRETRDEQQRKQQEDARQGAGQRGQRGTSNGSYT